MTGFVRQAQTQARAAGAHSQAMADRALDGSRSRHDVERYEMDRSRRARTPGSDPFFHFRTRGLRPADRAAFPLLKIDGQSRHDGSRFIGEAHLRHERRNIEAEERIVVVFQIVADHFESPSAGLAAYPYPRAEIAVRRAHAARLRR